MKVQVFKCGGKFFVSKIIKTFFEKLETNIKETRTLFVISAVAGMTRLLRLIFTIKTEIKIDEELKNLMVSLCMNEFKRVHTDLISDLFMDKNVEKPLGDFNELYSSLEKTINSYEPNDNNKDEFYATVLQYGELASSKILSNYVENIKIHNTWFDARDYVVTNNDFKEAEIIEVKKDFQQLFNDAGVLISQGFIGRTKMGENVVVGFDGSDYSATCFANSFLPDNEVMITFWKDVDGVYSANPSKDPSATLISQMTRDEYFKNVTRNNSFVVRPDSISNISSQIEVSIRSFINFENNGTHIK